MNVYDIAVLVLAGCSIFLYVGCILHYRDLQSAQDIVREVARGFSPEAEAPYQQVRALALFTADVASITDYRDRLARTCYNVFLEYGPEAEFPRYFGRQLINDYVRHLSLNNLPVPPYMVNLSNMDVGEFVMQVLRSDPIVRRILNAYVAEGLDAEAVQRIEMVQVDAQVITLHPDS